MNKNPYPGKFIVLEGLDGAGKSTQAAIIVRDLISNGKKAHLTQEPSQSLAGGIVRRRLLGEWSSSPECLQLLFAADRADHLEKEIIPMLKTGVNVVCDRYFLSSAAYGAVDTELDWLLQVNRRFLIPDLTIYLDVAPQVCVDRIVANGKSVELFEKVEILEKVGQNYKQAISRFAGVAKIAVLNGGLPQAEVFKNIKKSIETII